MDDIIKSLIFPAQCLCLIHGGVYMFGAGMGWTVPFPACSLGLVAVNEAVAQEGQSEAWHHHLTATERHNRCQPQITTHCRWPISRQVHKRFVLLYFHLQQGLAISISIFTAKTAKLGKYPDQQMKHEQLFIRLNTQNTPSYLKEKLFNIEWCLFTRLWLPVEIVKNPRSEPKERLTSTDFVCGT